MTLESSAETRDQQEAFFDTLWETAPKKGEFIELPEQYSKHDFLNYLVQKKNVLLHGSNWEVETLEPRQANCSFKEFGNQCAVYATEDEMLSLFHAIQNKETFRGTSQSGFSGDRRSDGTFISKHYHFAVEQKILDEKPWSDGIVYILSRESFEQGTNDDGELVYEFASKKPVKPLMKIRVKPNDFPYLDTIELIQK